MLDLGDGKIAARLADLVGLMADDPIADARADPSEILARELVRLRRAVVVDRVRSWTNIPLAMALNRSHRLRRRWPRQSARHQPQAP